MDNTATSGQTNLFRWLITAAYVYPLCQMNMGGFVIQTFLKQLENNRMLVSTIITFYFDLTASFFIFLFL